jgi:hypothetical protein
LRAGNAAALALAAAMVTATSPSAHRLDECLQAARIAVEPDHLTLELDITPGVAVAGAIVSAIDRDRDGVLSAAEHQDYATQVLDSVEVAIDGRQVHIASALTTFPALAALETGDGTIQLRSTLAVPSQQPGTHRVLFRNRYRPGISVYLANALVPESGRIAVTAQRREASQRDLTITYDVRPDRRSPSRWPWLLGGCALAAGIWQWAKDHPAIS